MEEPTLGAAALQDLMLQAEILVQYGMRTKAVERLQRIQELFPREEERNEDLQRLYLAAGITPRYAGAAPVPPAPAAPSPPTQPPSVPAAVNGEQADVSSFTRVAEITRKLYHQNNATAVLSTAANEIGGQWKVTRCVAAMRRPGLPPTALQEFHADGTGSGEAAALASVVTACQDLAVARGTVNISDTLSAAEVQPIRRALAELGITSLLALPLVDGEDHIGVLIFMQSSERNWHPVGNCRVENFGGAGCDRAQQCGPAAAGAQSVGNRREVGLLKRASYLDLVLAEAQRASQQATPLSILLMHFGRGAAMIKEFGESAVEATMEQVGQLFTANIRSNDLAFRYDTTTVAIILGDTAEKEALLAVEKLRKLVSDVKMPGKDHPLPFTAGLAEAVMRSSFDPVDIVTEVINRAEQALHDALTQGAGSVLSLAPNLASAAVA